MLENKMITTISKDFRHRITINEDLYKIDYQIKDFMFCVHIVGKGRLLVISGSYNIYWKPLSRKKINFNKISNIFKEIVNISDIDLEYNNVRIESGLKEFPRLFQSSPLNKHALLMGEISCKLYTGNTVREENIADKVNKNYNVANDQLLVSSITDDKKSRKSKKENHKKHPDDVTNGLTKEEIMDKILKNKYFNKASDNDKTTITDGVNLEEINSFENHRKNIICISSTRWDFLWQRPHHLMDRLSKKNNRVLYFNHSISMDYNEIQRILLNPELWRKRINKINDNLWVFSSVHLPVEQVNFIKDRLSLRDFNYKIQENALKFLIKSLDFKDPIIISYLAESINYLKNIPNKLLCYDCVDDFSGFSWTDKDLEKDELALIREADIVTTTAKVLFDRIKRLHSQTYLLPNAVDYNHFAINNIKQSVSKKNPVIGFIGAFYEWVDEELIEYLVKSREKWQFYFVGPVQSGMGKNVLNSVNVNFMGSKEYKTLPQFLDKMDVCIIPFKLNKITESANPIKLWEYMASGLPIVSTPIPEVKKFEHLIYLGDNKENFLLKIEEALKENSTEMKVRRRNIARKNDWNRRVEKLLKIINHNLKDKIEIKNIAGGNI